MMTDIADIRRSIREVESSIKAIEIALVSYAIVENDEIGRREFLRSKCEEFPAVLRYFGYSYQELKEENLALLREKSELLRILRADREAAAAQHSSQAAPVPLTSPRYPDSVFIFGDTVTEKFLAVGTCFAISSRHLLTVQHNLDPQNKSRLSGYAIAPYVSRDASGRIHIPKGFPRAVRILAYNTQMDYAIAELCKEPFDLVPIPISTEEVECDTNLKVYHCPVDIFNEEHVKDLTVFSACVKSARPTRHHVASNVGLYCGSSGGPFISQNGGAIGMHVESVNKANFVDIGAIGTNPIETKAEIVEAMEIISTTINSNAHAHASFSRGLVFSKCRKLLQYLRSLGII